VNYSDTFKNDFDLSRFFQYLGRCCSFSICDWRRTWCLLYNWSGRRQKPDQTNLSSYHVYVFFIFAGYLLILLTFL